MSSVEVYQLRKCLKDVKRFLENKDWGTVRYMEGSDVYDDIQNMLEHVNDALGDDHV